MSDVHHNRKEGSDVSYSPQEDCMPIGLTSLAKGQNFESGEYRRRAN
jgi:hypothetical protein